MFKSFVVSALLASSAVYAHMDVLNVHVGKSFQMFAALSVSWGLIADADTRSETSWRWMGKARTTLAAIYSMLLNKTYDGTIEFVVAPNQQCPSQLTDYKTETRSVHYGSEDEDGSTTQTEEWCIVSGEFSLVTVSNLPWLASDILLAPTCELSDGAMTLIFIRNRVSIWSLLKMFLQAERGQHVSMPIVNMVKCSQVRILPQSTKHGHVVADGELAELGPVHIRCEPKAVDFKVLA